ncbi:MAG: hypothetical protein M0Z54_12940 [Thermaerobacter sp.]|nr:hypothetical protein [Thermaerobacter sp.]
MVRRIPVDEYKRSRRGPTTVPLYHGEAREAGGADAEQRLVVWAEVTKLPQKEREAVTRFD